MMKSEMFRTQAAAERAARLAGQFLRKAQDADGAWRDFQLQPGRADSWTTAYIASRLLRAHRRWPDLLVQQSLCRATRFLVASRRPGGWSYNQWCDPDADTTAQVILYFSGVGELVRLRDYADLAKFQLADGHFATYKNCSSRPGWSRGHPEVTAVAVQAMSHILDPQHVILQRAEIALQAHIRGTHGSDCYWWLSRNYLARELAILDRIRGGASRVSIPSTCATGASCFDRGLALEAALLTGSDNGKLAAAIEDILQSQLTDGSWPVQPILRVTDPRARDFDDPLFDQSPVAADDRRTFTTATVLGALSKACP
jgi:hypothetical protein